MNAKEAKIMAKRGHEEPILACRGRRQKSSHGRGGVLVFRPMYTYMDLCHTARKLIFPIIVGSTFDMLKYIYGNGQAHNDHIYIGNTLWLLRSLLALLFMWWPCPPPHCNKYKYCTYIDHYGGVRTACCTPCV